ncbi:uncharacterized protein LOC142345315 isoform X2 [Convolutriloba macropyga]
MVDSELLSIIDSKLDNVQKSGAYREANIYYMLLLLSQIVANGSGKMADSVFELSLHRTLLKALFEIYHLNLNSENDKKRRVRILVACCYNSMKVSPATIIEFRKGGLVEVCNHYAENTSKYWNSEEELVFLFALSYAADFDANPEALRTAQINLYYLYYCGLQQALERDDHKSSEGGYALAEILTSVSRLALHNSNASFFIEHRIVKSCQIIIEAKFSQDEVKQALEILWTLSFQKKGCTEIKENTTLVDVIKSYEKDEDAKIAQAANGISFQLNVDQETSKVAAQDKQTQGTSVAQQDEEPKHIMISYSWQQAEVARELAERLKKVDGGRKVWLDIEKMEGNILERMAEGVEGASVVVCCYSESYKNSQACRSEAEYAFKLNKHIIYVKTQTDYSPNGWLGVMMGNVMYYTVTDKTSLEKKLSEIAHRIDKLNNQTVQESNDFDSKPRSLTDSIPVCSSGTDKSNFQHWNCDYVRKWLWSIKLEDRFETKENLRRIDGRVLAELQLWQTTAPDIFWKVCENSLGLKDSLDILVFSHALRELT